MKSENKNRMGNLIDSSDDNKKKKRKYGSNKTCDSDDSDKDEDDPSHLSRSTVQYIEAKTNLSLDEIYAWHQRFLVGHF